MTCLYTGFYSYVLKLVMTGYDWFFAVFFGSGPVLWLSPFKDNRSRSWSCQIWCQNQDRTGLLSTICINLRLRLETLEKLRFQALQMLLEVRVSQKLCKKGAYKNRP